MSGKQQLVCPHCGNDHLWSDEAASILYPVRMFDGGELGPQPEYTGGDYLVMDEGTSYQSVIWCRSCGNQLSAWELVLPPVYCDDCGIEVHQLDAADAFSWVAKVDGSSVCYVEDGVAMDHTAT